MHEGLAQLAELYPNCFRQPRQPLKIGIHNDVIARHPELRPRLIASALKTYTRSVGYLETLKAGAVRIDLEGNPVGTVTDADEENAKRKIAKAARRAEVKAIEDRSGGSPGQTGCGTRWTTKPDPGGEISTADAGRTTTFRVG